jgi:hypothetical protein
MNLTLEATKRRGSASTKSLWCSGLRFIDRCSNQVGPKYCTVHRGTAAASPTMSMAFLMTVKPSCSGVRVASIVKLACSAA